MIETVENTTEYGTLGNALCDTLSISYDEPISCACDDEPATLGDCLIYDASILAIVVFLTWLITHFAKPTKRQKWIIYIVVFSVTIAILALFSHLSMLHVSG